MCLLAHFDRSNQGTFEQKGVIRTSMALCSARPNVLGGKVGVTAYLDSPWALPTPSSGVWSIHSGP